MHKKKFNLMTFGLLVSVFGAQADEGLTVYGRGGNTDVLYTCTFAQFPVITFSQTGLSIRTKSDAMAEKSYLSVGKINFNLPWRTDVNGDGRVDIADIITVINYNITGNKVNKDVNRDGIVDKADVKMIVDEIAK